LILKRRLAKFRVAFLFRTFVTSLQKQLVTAKHKGICAVRSDQCCRSHVFNMRGSSWETAMRKVSEYERQAAACRKLAAQMKNAGTKKTTGGGGRSVGQARA